MRDRKTEYPLFFTESENDEVH